MSYDKWKLVYKDNAVEVRLLPADSEAYGIRVFSKMGNLLEDTLVLPPETLREIAEYKLRGDYSGGERILEKFSPCSTLRSFFLGTDLNTQSFMDSLEKAYKKEEKDFDAE